MYEQQHPPVLYIIIPLGVGPELCELPRIPLPRTPVNRLLLMRLMPPAGIMDVADP
jgi:hypothetical protein